MKTTKHEPITEAKSRKGGIMWRISSLFLIPISMILFLPGVVSMPIFWIIYGDSQFIARKIGRFYDLWIQRIKSAT